MNKLIVTLLMGVLLASCSSVDSKYEKAIEDFVQTDKKGTKYDLKFKAIEIKELQKITVADSVTFYTEKMEAERNKRIESIENTIKTTQSMLEKEQSRRVSSKSMIEYYQKELEADRQKVEDAKAWNPGWLAPFESKPQDEVLAIVVQCKYSAVPPGINTKVEETKNFILTADGTKCIRMTKADNPQ